MHIYTKCDCVHKEQLFKTTGESRECPAIGVCSQLIWPLLTKILGFQPQKDWGNPFCLHYAIFGRTKGQKLFKLL